MRKVVDNNRLMLKVCDFFYNQDFSQQTIAKKLKLSRPTVSKLLKKAKEEGIVKIILADIVEMDYVELEHQLEEKYSLKEVIIVDKIADDLEQKNEIGRATAQYLERILKGGDIVGVSMGTTVSKIPQFIVPGANKEITFLPLIGGIGQMGMEFHSNSIVEELSKVFKGHHKLMHAPARVSEKAVKIGLMKEPYLKEIIDTSEHLSVAVVSLGVPVENSTVMKTGYYQDEEIKAMWERKVAGDICMTFYDINGNTESFDEFNASVIGVNLKKLCEIPYAIGLAAGIEKISAVIGAINGGYINVLVTDVECAEKLMN